MSGFWKVSGRPQKGLRTVSGRCLEGVQKLSGRCVEGTQKIFCTKGQVTIFFTLPLDWHVEDGQQNFPIFRFHMIYEL